MTHANVQVGGLTEEELERLADVRPVGDDRHRALHTRHTTQV